MSPIQKIITFVFLVGVFFTFSSILNAQYIDAKWTVTGYFGESWFAEEEDIPGKHQEFELINQERAFSKVFEKNGLMNENTEVFVHRITCNGSKVAYQKVLYPFITVDGSNKAFYVYEGAIITLTFEK